MENTKEPETDGVSDTNHIERKDSKSNEDLACENIPVKECCEGQHSPNDPRNVNFHNSLENELDWKLGLDGTQETEKYRQLVYEYYLKSEDLENKCNILHRNLQEVKDAWDRAKQSRDEALKEKETMIIRYANGERKALGEKQMREKAEKKCKELSKENETLYHKLQAMTEEKARVCLMYDNKIYEQKLIKSESESIKNENCILENELKLCQHALKSQAELHRAAQRNVEELNIKILTSSQEAERAKQEAQEAIQCFKNSEENQAYILNKKVKEQQTSLILIKHERDDKEKQVKTLQSSLEFLQSKYKKILQENTELSAKVQQLEKEVLKTNKEIGELKCYTDEQTKNLSDLQKKTLHEEQCKLQLTKEKEQLNACKEMLTVVKLRNEDLENDLKSCRKREAEVLSFTQQLTDKTVQLQLGFTNLQNKVQNLATEGNELKKINEEKERKCANLLKQLAEEQKNHLEEKIKILGELDNLANKLKEQNHQNSLLRQHLFDKQGEVDVIRRKYRFSLREVQKELQVCRKSASTIFSNKSCTPSCTSLYSTYSERSGRTFTNDQVKVIQPEGQINPRIIIDRIVKLQRINARKSEKIDFLEDQVNTLIIELQRKSKLLQLYMLRQQSGTLSSNEMDETKTCLSRWRGVMASLYGAKVCDKHLTLDLCLNINKKLQAVLEDALLENITLKNNIDTLGAEVENLNKKLNS